MEKNLHVVIGPYRFHAWRILLFTLYLAVSFFLYQCISIGTPICFDDCLGYIPLMGQHGAAYLHTFMTLFRGWSVPVVFALFGDFTLQTEFRIVLFQTNLAYISWIIFALSCQSLLTNRYSKIAGFLLISLIMFGQGYYHFNQFLLSDSLALSYVLLQFSLCLLSTRIFLACNQTTVLNSFFKTLYVASFAFLSAVEIAARDSNLFLAVFGLLIIIIYNRSAVFDRQKKLLLTLILVALMSLQAPGASFRHLINSWSTLSGLVLPTPDIRAYFVAHGMPQTLAAAGEAMPPQDLGNVNLVRLRQEQKIVFKIDPDFIIKTDRIYILYLITHPLYVINNTLKYHDMIFEQEVGAGSPGLGTAPAYLHPLPTSTSPLIFPANLSLSPLDYVPFPIMLAFAVVYAVYAAFGVRHLTMLLPLIFIVAGGSNAILSFFGAFWEHSEMMRHAMIGSILFRIGFALSILFTADHWLTYGNQIARKV